MLKFKGLEEDHNKIYLSQRKSVPFFTLTFEAEDRYLDSVFVRHEEIDYDAFSKTTPKEGCSSTLIIDDNPEVGIMHFHLDYKTPNGSNWWSSRESIVSLIPGYACVLIHVSNRVYYMHLENVFEYLPEGYSVVKDLKDHSGELYYTIIKTEDAQKYPDYFEIINPIKKSDVSPLGWGGVGDGK